MAKEDKNNPLYKKWWFWVIIVVLAAAVGATGMKQDDGNSNDTKQASSDIEDYTDKDAKEAYNTLSASGLEVKFIFDRNNNGGFTEDGFVDYVLNSFNSDSYNENPFTVTKQKVAGGTVTLSLEYASILNEEKNTKEREARLEEKLGLVESMTACEQYGKRNYRNFKMHSILGKIAEYASDDDTWFLKYKVDANGYEDLTMECYVTGTSESPIVKSFTIY